MNKKMSKRQRDIKSKLMAAICMLLVSSIMMVSTTYAWFTLSTAPEVTGIQTAVGANGNLEMALLPTTGLVSDIESDVGDSMAVQSKAKANVTWGNLVDLSEGYGFDQITLFPAQLNAATSDDNGNPLTVADILLSTPKYGADGRITELVANGVTSTYEEGGFPQNDLFGVRAVGVASGMTDRQLAYRNARSAASTAMAQAKNTATNSLTSNGNALANIAITHGTNNAATHTQADITALLGIVDDLLGEATYTPADGDTPASVTRTPAVEGALEYIEQAYIQSILAYGASQASATALNDDNFILFKGFIDGADSLQAVLDGLNTYGVSVPGVASGPIDKLQDSISNVVQAKIKLEVLKANGGTGTDHAILWGDISPALTLLANTDAMQINGIPAGEIMNRINELAQNIGAGLTVSMASQGGVYADIADHCGDYNASIVIKEIKYDRFEFKDMPARMATDSDVETPYLTAVDTAVFAAGAPESADGTTKPLTDMYGYIIDLAFKTNAAESNLLLQQEGVDRIYDENGNTETMGKGSTMTMKSTTTDFTDEKVKDLMSAIRIVFFQNDGMNVLATAKLDTEHATQSADGWTAEMYLYEVTKGGAEKYEAATYESNSGKEYYTASTSTKKVYVEAPGIIDETTFNAATPKPYVKNDDGSYTQATSFVAGTTYYAENEETETTYTKVDDATAAQAQPNTLFIRTITADGENELTDNVITALTQNEAVQVSALVYLDGNHVGNDDVAATAATSVTGTMNLQFASSATLVPMEYADLHQPVSGTPLTAITVTDATAATATADATGTFNGDAVTINLVAKADYTLKGVTAVNVGGTDLAATAYKYSSGKLTFNHDGIAANTAIAITVTTEAVTQNQGG